MRATRARTRRLPTAYPLLVLREASLADLNSRLDDTAADESLPSQPALLSGIDAYDEDHIDEIRVGGVALKLVKPCTRCQITTTDQAPPCVGSSRLRRWRATGMNAALDGVTFGMNAIVAAGAGPSIHRGDSGELHTQVLSRRPGRCGAQLGRT